MVESKTVDNLGIGPSIRWAKDQEFIDRSIIKDSSLVSTQTSVEVTFPCVISEFDLLFQTEQRFIPWALFSPPQGYDAQKMRIFTYQAIPSIGTEERRMAQKKKIKKRIASRKKKQTVVDEDENSEVVITLLDYLDECDKMMEQISARRSQYSKG